MLGTRVLKREPVDVSRSVLGDDFPMRYKLAVESTNVLAYSKLRENLDALASAHELKATLSELGIQPFSKASVERYKTEMSRGHSPRLFVRHPKLTRYLSNVLQFVTVVAIGNAVVGWFVSWKLGLGALVTTVIGCSLAFEYLERIAEEVSGEWKRVPLQGYVDPVPEHVLLTAVNIKKQLPTVDLFVEQYVRTYIADPFLIVRHGEDEEYVEVWEEPKFENTVRGGNSELFTLPTDRANARSQLEETT